MAHPDSTKGKALALLTANGGNVKKTAVALGIPRQTLNRWARGQYVGRDAYNWVGLEHYTVTSTQAVSGGPVKLRVEFTSAGPSSGTVALFIDDKRVGEGTIARLVPFFFGSSEGLTVGRDPSTPVTESYQSPLTPPLKRG